MANISKIKVNNTTYDLRDTSKLSASLKGAANGVAELDSGSKVPTSQLPSSVFDVLDYSSTSAFPSTGAAETLYVDTSTDGVYRWGGSSYTRINPVPSSITNAEIDALFV